MGRHGRGCWWSELKGFYGEWDDVIEDIRRDNHRISATRRREVCARPTTSSWRG